MRANPAAGEIYRHFKGNLYQVVAVAEHTETGEQLVVYQALYGEYRIFARPLAMFLSPVDRQKYPSAPQEYRFEKLPTLAAGQPQYENLKSPETTAAPLKTAKPSKENQTAPEPPRPSAKAKSVTAAEGAKPAFQLDEKVFDFLDADTYEEKFRIFVSMKHRLTHDMINTMAMAMDTEVPEGALEERVESLNSFLAMQVRFECNGRR